VVRESWGGFGCTVEEGPEVEAYADEEPLPVCDGTLEGVWVVIWDELGGFLLVFWVQD
jgi:hypothetical protein